MQEITEGFIQVVAGDLEKLMFENRDAMNFAYKKIKDGMKIGIGITLDPSTDGIVVNYSLGFDLEVKAPPPEKQKVNFKRTINEAQATLFPAKGE